MTRFEPAKYSLEELGFLHEHVGEPPVVAMGHPMPKGVNPTAVREVLATVYDLEQLREHRGISWTGIAAIQASILAYVEADATSIEMHKRGSPRFPSMYHWDAKGRPHRYGPGSDSDFVRTAFTANGELVELGVDLIPGGRPSMGKFVAPWIKPAVELPRDFTEDLEKGFVQCPICGFAQNYNKDSQHSRNMARARVSKHCKEFKGAESDQHRELYTHLHG